jgi:pyruvate/2-oxoglutarate dehydrogenase complex dihydrolipoamide acyltransferase (E2) component
VRRLGLRFDVVTPFAGIIDKILFQLGNRVEEGDAIFTLKSNGVTHNILAPITGYPDTVEVDQGDVVIPGMILTSIVETDDQTG